MTRMEIDYTKFKLLKENREIDINLVKKLIISISKKNKVRIF